jgi:hypothetical protein
MKTVKIQLDDKILKLLEVKAKKLGMKTNAYIQLVLGQHVNQK